MPNQSILYLIGFLITSISFLNFEVNAGINKKDFKSKTVSELIDVLNNDKLLEKKVLEKIDKKLMCKLKLFSLPTDIKNQKESIESTAISLQGNPYQEEAMKQQILVSENFTIMRLKEIDKYCN